MKSIAKAAHDMPRYETHHLSIEEMWYAREHPFDLRVTRVKKAIKKLTDLEDQIEAAQKEVEELITTMNDYRGQNEH